VRRTILRHLRSLIYENGTFMARGLLERRDRSAAGVDRDYIYQSWVINLVS